MSDHAPTWNDPLGPHPWTRLTWRGMEALRKGLVLLAALDQEMRITAVGTGFVIARDGRTAVCVTAAHVFYAGIHRIQHPHDRHHPSTPPEFRKNFERVDIKGVFGIFFRGDDIVAAPVTGAAWDKQRDLCVFEAEPNERDAARFEPDEIRIAAAPPLPGERVAIIGYAGITNSAHEQPETGVITSALEYRTGTITSIDEGLLVRGLVATTTIPVYSGMSGSPAIFFDGGGKLPLVFGFVSSDGEPAMDADKEDFSIAGDARISILDVVDARLVEDEIRLGVRIGPIAACIGSLKSGFIADADRALMVKDPWTSGGATPLGNRDLFRRDVRDAD